MSSQDLNKKVRDFARPVKTVVEKELTIEQALTKLRAPQIDEKILYFYVVDQEGVLLGVVSTRKLLLNDTQSKIVDIMDKSVICLTADQTLREALDFLDSHRLLALPVIDENQKFIGVIDVDLYIEESIDFANAGRRADVFQLLGMHSEEGKKFSLWKQYRNRVPWISCNLVGGFVCVAISHFYEVVLSQVVLLAMFIPLLLTLSESISMQSVTQSMQLLRHKHISFDYRMRHLGGDLLTVSMIALTCGILVSFFSLFWGGGMGPSVTIGTSIFLSVNTTAFIGAATPLILHGKRWDPKVAAGPVVLMFADTITTAIYLSLGFWWLT